ncbi:hypothetical protein ID866_7531 [Astraeus odoratus]|nr:hypothetical protein ID866_7531 [Astraeus odoratus]
MGAKILVLGSGGREHALSWKLAKSPLVDHIYVCPGNGGTAGNPKTTNVELPLEQGYYQDLIDLVVPGVKEPLVLGIEEHFGKAGIPVFGPSELAARIGSSKAFSKAFMKRHGIPTPKSRTFSSAHISEAIVHVHGCGYRVVLKSSGPAAGSRVLFPSTIDEAIVMVQNITYGARGNEIVIGELLEGPQVSFLAFSDGQTILPLPPVEVPKRHGKGDTGLGTDAMGAYAPALVAPLSIWDRVMKKIIRPTTDGMRKEGFPFVGLLSTDIVLTDRCPKVLEYHAWFGEGETEALMVLLGDDVDLAAVFFMRQLEFDESRDVDRFSISAVLVSGGYPGPYDKGKRIDIGNIPSGVVVFHCGTTLKNNELFTSGGHVVTVTAMASMLEEASRLTYTTSDQISSEGKVYRRDIAHRAQAPSRAIFDLNIGYKDRIIVSSARDVGTKIRIAIETGVHDTVGIDLVAMCVDDLLA